MYIAAVLVIAAGFGALAGEVFNWWGVVLTLPVSVLLGHIGARAEKSR